VVRNYLLTAIGLGFVALAILPMALGDVPWTAREPWIVLLFFAGCAVAGMADIVQSYRPARAEVTPSNVVLRYDRVRLLGLGVASAGWLAAGILGLSGTVFPSWLAWVLIAFAGLCAVVLLPMGLDGRAKVVVDAEGIADYRRLSRKIAWGEIEAISLSHLRAVPSVSLRLRNPGAHKLSTIGRIRSN
jgi:MFS family permease